MDVERYRLRLKEEEERLRKGIGRADDAGRDPGDVPAGDAADRSVRGERREEKFREADTEWSRLRQVQEALERVDAGVYGRCVVDGKPIEEKRLEAMPWTPYCRTHQEQFEGDRPSAKPTL